MSKKLSESNLLKRQNRSKRINSYCCLGDILLELMNEWKVEAVDVHRATGIPYSTLSGYINFKIQVPLLNGNILALAKFFNTTIDYLCFGIGEEPVRPGMPLKKEVHFDQSAKNKEFKNMENV